MLILAFISFVMIHVCVHYRVPGESDDDREELLSAANLAYNSTGMFLSTHSLLKIALFSMCNLITIYLHVSFYDSSCLFKCILEDGGGVIFFNQLRWEVLPITAGGQWSKIRCSNIT